MKKFTLLQLFPVTHNQSGNRAISDFICPTIQAAITHFKSIYQELPLDNNGYFTDGNTSYCIAEEYNQLSSNNT